MNNIASNPVGQPLVYAVFGNTVAAQSLSQLWSFEMDENQVRKKVLLRTLGHPLVLAPFLAGMTAMTMAISFTNEATFGVFSGIAGALGSAGVFLTRMIFKGEATARQVTEELAGSETQQRQLALDELDHSLTNEDDDSRPEVALRDLRAFVNAFDKLDEHIPSAHTLTMVEIRMKVQELFEHCVKSLRQTSRLWQTAQQLNSPDARQPLLAQRESIISDVQVTLRQLSHTLVGLQTLDSANQTTNHFQKLRDDLDQSLSSARDVESRIQSLLDEKDYDISEFIEQPTQKLKG